MFSKQTIWCSIVRVPSSCILFVQFLHSSQIANWIVPIHVSCVSFRYVKPLYLEFLLYMLQLIYHECLPQFFNLIIHLVNHSIPYPYTEFFSILLKSCIVFHLLDNHKYLMNNFVQRYFPIMILGKCVQVQRFVCWDVEFCPLGTTWPLPPWNQSSSRITRIRPLQDWPY